MNTLRKLVRDESGATAIEYGMIAALISAVIIGTIGLIGGHLFDAFESIETQLAPAADGG